MEPIPSEIVQSEVAAAHISVPIHVSQNPRKPQFYRSMISAIVPAGKGWWAFESNNIWRAMDFPVHGLGASVRRPSLLENRPKS